MTQPVKSKAKLADSTSLPQIGDRQAAIADSATTGSTTTTPYGYTTSAQADGIVTKLNSILAALRAHGLIAD